MGNIFVGLRQREYPRQLSQARLQPIPVQALDVLCRNCPHAHLGFSSISFETLATHLINEKAFEDACEALFVGIRHDLHYKRVAGLIEKTSSPGNRKIRNRVYRHQRVRREPRDDRLPNVSYRLYDQMAKLAVQSNNTQYLDKLIVTSQ
jgi:hypothetical protein